MFDIRDRDSLLRAMSIVDLLDAGWRPGKAELADARHVESWAILPSAERIPYRIMGLAADLRNEHAAFIAAVIAIDLEARWARIWDEWVVIGDQMPGSEAVDPHEIRRAGAAWLLEQARQLPALA